VNFSTLRQDLVGVLAQQRRALHLGDRVGHLDRVADRQVLAAGRMIDLDHGAGVAQRLLLGSSFIDRIGPTGMSTRCSCS
jgi:hypothetical protein